MRGSHLTTLSLALALGLAMPAGAPAMPIRIGIEGGPALATLHGAKRPLGDDKSLRTWGAGLTARLPLRAAFELQTGVSFAVKGISLGESDATDGSGSVVGTFETLLVTHQIEIPVLVRWSVSGALPVRPFVQGGAFAGVELGEWLRSTGTVTVSDASRRLRGVDGGLVLGAGIEKHLGQGCWDLGAHYELGLVPLGHLGPNSNLRSARLAITTGHGF